MENILFGQTSDQLNLIEKAKNVLKHYEQQQSRSMFNIFPWNVCHSKKSIFSLSFQPRMFLTIIRREPKRKEKDFFLFLPCYSLFFFVDVETQNL